MCSVNCLICNNCDIDDFDYLEIELLKSSKKSSLDAINEMLKDAELCDDSLSQKYCQIKSSLRTGG